MDKLRIGIIGIGNIGTTHCKNILNGKCPELTLAAACDRKPEKLGWVRENFGEGTALFSDAEEMMDSGLIDAVLVSVPHYDHARLACMAMRKGLHVMVEKPAGVYTLQAREMNETAAETGVVFGMMFNQRTNWLYRAVKELIDSGRYGRIRRVSWIITDWYRPSAYYESGEWRATWSGEGGGVLLNQCPHQLDLLQWLCGMPVTVDAHLQFGKWHDVEVEDDVSCYLEFPDGEGGIGATGVFVTSTGDACGSNRLEVQMDKAKIVVENGELRAWEFEQSEPEFSRTNRQPFAAPKVTPIEVETDGRNDQHAGVMNAFAGAILRGEPLVARGEEGLNGLMISNAMHLSAWLGRPVSLPIDEELFLAELTKRRQTSRKKKAAGEVAAADMESSFNFK